MVEGAPISGGKIQVNIQLTAEELRMVDLVVSVRGLPSRVECFRQLSLNDVMAEARRIEGGVAQATVA